MKSERMVLTTIARRVAQIFNLLFRRIAFCGAWRSPVALRVAMRSRLQIGETADCKSALRIGGALAVLTLLFLTGCSPRQDATAGKQLYTCGMHPQVIQDQPGNCPICGMKLTPIRATAGAGANAATDWPAIATDPAP